MFQRLIRPTNLMAHGETDRLDVFPQHWTITQDAVQQAVRVVCRGHGLVALPVTGQTLGSDFAIEPSVATSASVSQGSEGQRSSSAGVRALAPVRRLRN